MKFSLATVELGSSLQAHCTKIPCLNLQFLIHFRSIDLGGGRGGGDGDDDRVGKSGTREGTLTFMTPFQPYCCDLNVPAECTEGFLSISRIDKCKDDFQTDSAPGLATVILYPKWLGCGERETETETRERDTETHRQRQRGNREVGRFWS